MKWSCLKRLGSKVIKFIRDCWRSKKSIKWIMHWRLMFVASAESCKKGLMEIVWFKSWFERVLVEQWRRFDFHELLSIDQYVLFESQKSLLAWLMIKTRRSAWSRNDFLVLSTSKCTEKHWSLCGNNFFNLTNFSVLIKQLWYNS
jgi:hypothetical protein